VSQLEGGRAGGRWTRQPRFGGVAPGGSHRPSGGVGPEGRRICGDGDELPAEPVAGGRRRRSRTAANSRCGRGRRWSGGGAADSARIAGEGKDLLVLMVKRGPACPLSS
jgi:hypothetical protein